MQLRRRGARDPRGVSVADHAELAAWRGQRLAAGWRSSGGLDARAPSRSYPLSARPLCDAAPTVGPSITNMLPAITPHCGAGSLVDAAMQAA